MTGFLPALGLGFVLGSIPAAWVLVRLVAGRDVSTEGSGNVGALNASRVARSRLMGAGVLLADALKGALAAWLPVASGWIAGEATTLHVAGTLGAVAGHNYNPWLSLAARRVVGGKGFAAACGALLVFVPLLVAAWLLVCTVAWFLIRRLRAITDEAPATAVATLALVPAGAALYGAPAAWLTGGLLLLVLPRLVVEVLGILAASGRQRARDDGAGPGRPPRGRPE